MFTSDASLPLSRSAQLTRHIIAAATSPPRILHTQSIRRELPDPSHQSATSLASTSSARPRAIESRQHTGATADSHLPHFQVNSNSTPPIRLPATVVQQSTSHRGPLPLPSAQQPTAGQLQVSSATKSIFSPAALVLPPHSSPRFFTLARPPPSPTTCSLMHLAASVGRKSPSHPSTTKVNLNPLRARPPDHLLVAQIKASPVPCLMLPTLLSLLWNLPQSRSTFDRQS